MTTTSSPRLNWPIVLLAGLGALVALPFVFAFSVVALALTVGLIGKLFKVGIAVLAIWAIAAFFKSVSGSKRPAPALARITTVPHFAPDAELEREKRDGLAALDKELARAIAKKNDPRGL
jgi:hypothetical protein